MLLIATIMGVVGAALFRRGARAAAGLQSLKARVFAAAATKSRVHPEIRR
jgi:hypothetical protein